MKAMCKSTLVLAGLTITVIFWSTGCSGPEQKLGRGINNLTEFARMGEISRSVEQTMLTKGHDVAYTAGFIRGINRSVARTLVGAYEVVTFPIPSYDPYLAPGNRFMSDATVDPTYPDNYTPKTLAVTTFETDATLGFSGGDIAPMIPGSRFRIFDY